MPPTCRVSSPLVLDPLKITCIPFLIQQISSSGPRLCHTERPERLRRSLRRVRDATAAVLGKYACPSRSPPYLPGNFCSLCIYPRPPKTHTYLALPS